VRFCALFVALFIALSGFQTAEARNRSDQLHPASHQKKAKKYKPGKYKASKHKKPKKAKWGAKTRNI
jgi:hypothetical protein